MSGASGASILFSMTTWIVLVALIIAFALAARHDTRWEPQLPPGHDGERQLAELRARGMA